MGDTEDDMAAGAGEYEAELEKTGHGGESIWTMKDGRNIKIKDMTDSHLYNTIKMLERAAEAEEDALWSMAGFFNGEMASESIERELAFIEEEGAYIYPIYADLKEEYEKRQEKYRDES